MGPAHLSSSTAGWTQKSNFRKTPVTLSLKERTCCKKTSKIPEAEETQAVQEGFTKLPGACNERTGIYGKVIMIRFHRDLISLTSRISQILQLRSALSLVRRPAVIAVFAICALALLPSCSFIRKTNQFATDSKSSSLPPTKVTTLAINSYLWRAALETIRFMPVNQSDAASGVILTDWYSDPKLQNERIKLGIYILGQDLRSDSIHVVVNRQMITEKGRWVDVSVRAGTAEKLEDAILTRARQIRLSSIRRR